MEVQEQFGPDVQIIGIPGLSDAQSMRRFIAGTQVQSIVHIDDPSGELWARFGITEQRQYVLVDDDGARAVRRYGTLAPDVEELVSR